MKETTAVQAFPTLSFETFYAWLQAHPSCILRAGTADVTLYDDDDLHWAFVSEEQSLYVQLVRGKRLVGELSLTAEDVTYVQGTAGEREGEFVFELISEAETERTMAAFFVMAHAFEEDGEHSRPVH
jgi:hypothetical protein